MHFACFLIQITYNFYLKQLKQKHLILIAQKIVTVLKQNITTGAINTILCHGAHQRTANRNCFVFILCVDPYRLQKQFIFTTLHYFQTVIHLGKNGHLFCEISLVTDNVNWFTYYYFGYIWRVSSEMLCIFTAIGHLGDFGIYFLLSN